MHERVALEKKSQLLYMLSLARNSVIRLFNLPLKERCRFPKKSRLRGGRKASLMKLDSYNVGDIAVFLSISHYLLGNVNVITE